MSASLLYRISSVTLVLFALGHTIGFRHVDPAWSADKVVSGMRSVTFEVQKSPSPLGLLDAAWLGARGAA